MLSSQTNGKRSRELTNKSVISAIGTANPAYRQNQTTAAEIVSTILNLDAVQKRLLKSIYKSTGIEYRHSVLSDSCKKFGEFEFFPNELDAEFPSTAQRMKIYKDNALDLALAAIKNCLDQLKDFNPQQITHVITVSCTGMYAPGIDIEIIQKLNLNSNVKRTAINFMGCYGAFNGIKVADALCKSESNAKVLVVCVELCTIHFQKKSDIDNIVANAIFADGAACVLIESELEQKKCFGLEAFHCDLLPQTSQEMAWHIADSGFDMILTSYVPEAIESGIAIFLQKLIAQTNLAVSDIDFFAIHPGGLKILQACQQSLSTSAEQNKYSYDVLREYGNMSSATVLFVLKKIWDDIANTDNLKNIFSCAFGPGLTLESMMLKIKYVQ